MIVHDDDVVIMVEYMRQWWMNDWNGWVRFVTVCYMG